jgi:transcriptional regulator with XRE-family HTH domain
MFMMRQQSQHRRQIQKALGDRIKCIRTKRGWPSQKALADACGMNGGHLGEIERGQVDVCLTTVAGIAKTLNITVSKLFDGIA